MFDTPQSQETIRVVPKLGGLALEDLNLETEPVVQMDMEGREDTVRWAWPASTSRSASSRCSWS